MLTINGRAIRHTYATFRLMEGIDVYFLAKQMGTSVKMIEDYYGRITPAKNAERILQGMPGWKPIAWRGTGQRERWPRRSEIRKAPNEKEVRGLELPCSR